MRICRYRQKNQNKIGFYDESAICPLETAVAAFPETVDQNLQTAAELISLLPNGEYFESAKRIHEWLQKDSSPIDAQELVAVSEVQLLVPIPRPNKLFLLAGNYAAHVEEGGEIAAERSETFPYVFMKPPTTTLRSPNSVIPLPSVSPAHIDYELELAVIIGQTAKGISEANALDYVAGYTIINDLSDREFHPNPNRREREKDKFFDWLHGKWHDGFCPCGPCVASADSISDPQTLSMQLTVNGEIRQDASTALQIFPVAAVIEFISSFVTLEPGDIISTGTPSGVGAPKGVYLQPGDRIKASIGSIGTLETIISD